MNTTDDKRPWYGKMEVVHPRANKIIFTAEKSSMDGEDAWQIITIGSIEQRKAFVDQLGNKTEVDGYEGLEELFGDWLKQQRRKVK